MKLYKSISPSTENIQQTKVDKFFIRNKISKNENVIKKYFQKKTQRNKEIYDQTKTT